MKLFKIAHRGAKGYQPENTLIAFETAMKMGADAIELDTYLSADGEIMVIHDETINTTTNGYGFINQLTLSELKSYKILDKYEIPTLEEVFKLVNRSVVINIEIKDYKCVQKIIVLIEKYVLKKNWLYEDFLISSFEWNFLREIYFLNKKIPTGVLTYSNIDEAIEFAEYIKAKTIHPHYHLLNKKIVGKMQKKNLLVNT